MSSSYASIVITNSESCGEKRGSSIHDQGGIAVLRNTRHHIHGPHSDEQFRACDCRAHCARLGSIGESRNRRGLPATLPLSGTGAKDVVSSDGKNGENRAAYAACKRTRDSRVAFLYDRCFPLSASSAHYEGRRESSTRAADATNAAEIYISSGGS